MTEAELLTAGYVRTSDPTARVQLWEKHEGPSGSRRLTDELLWDSVDEEERDVPEDFDTHLLPQLNQNAAMHDLIVTVVPAPPVQAALLAAFSRGGSVRGGGGGRG